MGKIRQLLTVRVKPWVFDSPLFRIICIKFINNRSSLPSFLKDRGRRNIFNTNVSRKAITSVKIIYKSRV